MQREIRVFFLSNSLSPYIYEYKNLFKIYKYICKYKYVYLNKNVMIHVKLRNLHVNHMQKILLTM